MTAALYVQSVIDRLPHSLPLREQVAMELRSHIAERLGEGQPLDDVLRQLGDPLSLAESYLAAVPLESAPLLPRFAAKLIDAAVVSGVVLALAALLTAIVPREALHLLLIVCVLSASFGFFAYTVIAEYLYGRTLGKQLMGIQVVRESGARISLGQSFVRQLPLFAQFFLIDALFALFTERRQRAFELLTKTRAVALLVCLMIPATIENAGRAAGAAVHRSEPAAVAAPFSEAPASIS